MECLGLHQGGAQSAWLDARGWQDELFLYREGEADELSGVGGRVLSTGRVLSAGLALRCRR
jgi:hypothetical protein